MRLVVGARVPRVEVGVRGLLLVVSVFEAVPVVVGDLLESHEETDGLIRRINLIHPGILEAQGEGLAGGLQDLAQEHGEVVDALGRVDLEGGRSLEAAMGIRQVAAVGVLGVAPDDAVRADGDPLADLETEEGDSIGHGCFLEDGNIPKSTFYISLQFVKPRSVTTVCKK